MAEEITSTEELSAELKRVTIARLQEIAQKNTGSITADDKAYIRDTAEKNGENFAPSSKCKECYKDMAIILYRKISGGKDMERVVYAGDKTYHLPVGKQLNWFGSVITEDTLTDTLAESIIAAGFPASLFVHED